MRLDHEGVRSSDALGIADVDLAAGEAGDVRVVEIDAEMLGNFLGQGRMRRPRVQHHVLLGDDLLHGTHASPSPSIYRARFRAAFPFPFAFRRFAYPSTTRCSARSTARAPSGTSLVMAEPAPVTASRPTRIGATNIVSEPMNARSPMMVRCFSYPS